MQSRVSILFVLGVYYFHPCAMRDKDKKKFYEII